jgi:putative salt-induced outer membrane protein
VQKFLNFEYKSQELVMKKYCYWLTLASLLTVSGNALAAEEDAKSAEKSPWKSSAELGFIKTTGNTETQTTALKADAVYEVDKWRHTGHAEGFGQQSVDDATGEKVVSAERYELTGKSDYKFTELNYAFGQIKLKKDRFSGFEYENSLSLGYGRKAIKQDNMELDLEIGPGVRFYKPDNGEAQDEALLVLAAKYWWAITDNSKFMQDLTFDIGEEYTESKSVTGIQANINKTLALKFTYTVRHKSVVPDPATTDKTDTETAVTLVYNF